LRRLLTATALTGVFAGGCVAPPEEPDDRFVAQWEEDPTPPADKLVHVGMSRDEVAAVLGPPDTAWFHAMTRHWQYDPTDNRPSGYYITWEFGKSGSGELVVKAGKVAPAGPE